MARDARLVRDPHQKEIVKLFSAFDGGRQRGLVDERWFPENYTGRFPARAYEVT